MVIDLKSDDTEYPLQVQVGNVQIEDSEVTKPNAMIWTSLAQATLSMGSVYLMWKNQQMHFMSTASYASIMVLSILYFQLFGVYIILALQYSTRYFQYLTLSGIACFLTSITTNKLSVVFFLFQYANHPQIDNSSWASPRTKFYVITIVAQLACYLAAFFLCKFPGFVYYVAPFYLFPLVHIANSSLKKTKVTFRW